MGQWQVLAAPSRDVAARAPRLAVGREPRGANCRPPASFLKFLGYHLHPMNPLTQKLIEKIISAPEGVQQEVIDCLVRLARKKKEPNGGYENLLPLAQTTWGTDWDDPVEDEAWRDL